MNVENKEELRNKISSFENNITSLMDHISETLKVVSDVGKLIKNQEKDLEDKMVKQGKSLGRGTYIHKIRRD